jgi:hypothetical protein
MRAAYQAESAVQAEGQRSTSAACRQKDPAVVRPHVTRDCETPLERSRQIRFLGWLDAGAALVGGDPPSPLPAQAVHSPQVVSCVWFDNSAVIRLLPPLAVPLLLKPRVGRRTGHPGGRGGVRQRRRKRDVPPSRRHGWRALGAAERTPEPAPGRCWPPLHLRRGPGAVQAGRRGPPTEFGRTLRSAAGGHLEHDRAAAAPDHRCVRRAAAPPAVALLAGRRPGCR